MKTYKEFRVLNIDEFEEIENSAEYIIIGEKLFHLYSETVYETNESVFVLEDEYGYAILLNGHSYISHYALRKYLDRYPSIERGLTKAFADNKTSVHNDDLFTFVI